MRCLIDFVYILFLRIMFFNIYLLFLVVSLFQFLIVENVCYDFFRDSINVNNSFEIWSLVDLYGCLELFELVENFICVNFVVILKFVDFNCFMFK